MGLQDLLVLDLYVLFMTFARLGAAISVMPGFSARVVPVQVRLLFALFMTVAGAPLIAPLLPPQPDGALALTALLVGEVMVGLFFGLFAQVMVAALQIAGTVIAYSASMANAFSQDPISGSQSSVPSRFFTQLGLILIFAVGLDRLMIGALFESYAIFVPGMAIPVGDVAEFFSRAVNESMVVAMKLSAPFVLVALVFQGGLGMLNKLMPQLPIFFVAMPAQVGIGLLIIYLTVPIILMVFGAYFENGLEDFLAPGAGQGFLR